MEWKGVNSRHEFVLGDIGYGKALSAPRPKIKISSFGGLVSTFTIGEAMRRSRGVQELQAETGEERCNVSAELRMYLTRFTKANWSWVAESCIPFDKTDDPYFLGSEGSV